MDLADFADVAQIVGGVFTGVAVIVGYLEYQKSKRARRIDLALDALRNWDDKINGMTAAGMALLQENDAANEIALAIKSNQAIKRDRKTHQSKLYGFLIDDTDEIPAHTVNEVRISLINFINAWEFVAALYTSGRADKKLIEEQLFPDKFVSETVVTLLPFMDLHGQDSWGPLRNILSGTR